MDGTSMKNVLARLGYLCTFAKDVNFHIVSEKIPIYRVRLAQCSSCSFSLIFESAICFILNTNVVA